jgi:tellurite resistance protein
VQPPLGRLDADDAFVAVFIAAMEASGHTSPQEAERAHHIIWSMRRFRNRDGDEVGLRIERMRQLIEQRGADAVIASAAPRIPAAQREPAFALTADIVLVDGRMARGEAAFLRQLAGALRVDPRRAAAILDVMRTKNRA